MLCVFSYLSFLIYRSRTCGGLLIRPDLVRISLSGDGFVPYCSGTFGVLTALSDICCGEQDEVEGRGRTARGRWRDYDEPHL